MKNFIKNVKEHKLIALACLGVWLIIALAVMIVITVNNGRRKRCSLMIRIILLQLSTRGMIC